MIGQKIGPFEVLALLGKGGMGEVYRARDGKLNRDVALKILPDVLAGQSDRLARFQREAKVLAALQHQNIASIYGLEEFGQQPVLIMELAEGDELGDRIAAGSLTQPEITKIALQMARGLEYAHEQGVVHRDLKPANVKVFGDGQVKILDFGLARAMDPGNSDETQASTPFIPTVTQGLTVAGTVLGTAAYMSPEQARGYNVDRRSDIWSFGVILYEMLTGERLFEGETATDTLAAILHKEPDFEAIPEDASPILVQVCRRCLEKDPNNRLRDIGEVRVALEGSASTVIGLSTAGMPAPEIGPAPSRPSVLPWVAVAVLAVALGLVSFLGMTGRLSPEPDPPPLVHTSVALPSGLQINLNPASPGPTVVSPDGRRLAFAATDSNGQVLLYVRDLDDPLPRAIAGTNGAHYPFWSPDSRTVAFFSPNRGLARVDINGGPVITICPADNGKGGSWSKKDVILFAANHIAPISRVPASGGEAVAVTDLQGELDFRSHRFPQWLPDGESFIYIAVGRTGSGLGSESVLRYSTPDNPQGRDLMPCQNSAIYEDGQIMFIHDSILMARPFDVDRGEFTAAAEPMVGGVLAIPAAHLSVISASQGAHVLAYSAGTEQAIGSSILVSHDPVSGDEKVIGEPLLTYGFDIHPDGSKVLLALPDSRNGTFDIWILEVERNLMSRFTFESESELMPLFGPAGDWIYYASDREGRSNIHRRRTTGVGEPELLFSSKYDCMPSSFSPDGRLLSYTAVDSSGRFMIEIFDLESEEIIRPHGPVSYAQGAPTFSPDGNWIAFISDETGDPQIFVESMIAGGGRYRVSSVGGYFPIWASSGNLLYYLAPSGEVKAVEVFSNPSGGLSFGAETTVTSRVETADWATLKIDRSTDNLVVLRSTQGQQKSLLSLVVNWQHLVEKED